MDIYYRQTPKSISGSVFLSVPLFYGNFIDAPLVATAFKIGIQKGIENVLRRIGVDESTGHHADIGIVVLARQSGNFLAPAKGSAYALMLVERHVDTVAAAANSDAGIALAALHRLCQRVGIVGIVAAFRRTGTEIPIRNFSRFELRANKLLQFISGMIAGKTYRNIFFQNIHIPDRFFNLYKDSTMPPIVQTKIFLFSKNVFVKRFYHYIEVFINFVFPFRNFFRERCL